MSRSFRHTPVFGVTCPESSKWYKKKNHRRERARYLCALSKARKTGNYDDLDIVFSPHDMWDDPRDGKYYSSNFYPSCGYGIHFDARWRCIGSENDKKERDEDYKKALRK
jgi:hypothetical protein